MKGDETDPLLTGYRGRIMVSRLGACIVAIVLVTLGFATGFLGGYLSRAVEGWGTVCLQSVPQKIQNNGEADLAERLMKKINAENIRANLRNLTSNPHLAGTEDDHKLAFQLQQYWNDIGLDRTNLETYQVLLSYPDLQDPNYVSILDQRNTEVFKSQIFEKILNPSLNRSDIVPPFNAFSNKGDFEGDVLYVNYARLEDFEWLKENKNIDFKGRIAIARYGKTSRMTKASLAESFGFSGLILYSDPKEYNPTEGEDKGYPHSWWMPETGVQRGSLVTTGDPLTPGYPATESAYRRPEEEAKLPKIAVQPISYGDARIILTNMAGDVAPSTWQGDLPLTYKIGPGFTNRNWRLKLHVSTHTRNVTIHNVFGFIEGSVEPDRYVLIGNHLDAWVFGAADPSSGTAAVLMELARAMSELVSSGWRPRRTIVFCGWAAEEYGLVGSREWVEQVGSVLADRAVGYLNVDIAVEGTDHLRVKALPMLKELFYRVAKQIPNPNESEVKSGRKTIFDTWLYTDPVDNLPSVKDLGSGSDYDPLVNMIGVTSSDIRYTFPQKLGLSSYPLYHSAYETIHMVEKYLDPNFAYHVAVARVIGEAARSMAEDMIIPYDVTAYPYEIGKAIEQLDSTFGELLRSHGSSKNIDYLKQANDRFTETAKEFADDIQQINTDNPYEVRRVNDQIMGVERAFIDTEGLPGRPMDRHVVFAPSALDSYAGARFPGVFDSLSGIEKLQGEEAEQRWKQVHQQLASLVYHIDLATAVLRHPVDL